VRKAPTRLKKTETALVNN